MHVIKLKCLQIDIIVEHLYVKFYAIEEKSEYGHIVFGDKCYKNTVECTNLFPVPNMHCVSQWLTLYSIGVVSSYYRTSSPVFIFLLVLL